MNGPTRLSDRARGCIFGGAIGDSMGGPFEGQPGPITFAEHSDWRISDDTQLTLATCESIVEVGKVSPEHIASRFVEWYRARRITRVGSSTLKALRDLDAGQHWALAGAKGEIAAGNGAAMRIAPLAFSLDPKLEQDRQFIRDVSRITHHNEEAYVGALAIAIAVRSLVSHQVAPTDLLEVVVKDLPDSRVRDRILALEALRSEPLSTVASKFGSSGYVVDSVPLAIFAARSIDRTPLFDVLRNTIEVGGDTDTIASMTGQVAGAWLGASQIPRKMIASLPNKPDIERIADDFAKTAKS